MSAAERLALYETVSDAVERRPGESIMTACQRLSPNDPVVRALGGDAEPWERMRLAAAAAATLRQRPDSG